MSTVAVWVERLYAVRQAAVADRDKEMAGRCDELIRRANRLRTKGAFEVWCWQVRRVLREGGDER